MSPGAEMALNTGDMVQIDQGLHELDNGKVVFVRRMHLGVDVLGLGAGGDSRLNPYQRYHAWRVRCKYMSSSVARMLEEPLQDHLRKH